MFISMADLQGYLKKVLDAKKQRGCCKIAAIYKIWHSGLKNPIHIWYISCILQQSTFATMNCKMLKLKFLETRKKYKKRLTNDFLGCIIQHVKARASLRESSQRRFLLL